MPKPMRKNNWKSQYNDRDHSSSAPESRPDMRRVTFKQSRGPNRHERTRDWGATIRAHLAEEDVDMSANILSAKYIGGKRNFQRGKFRGRSGSPVTMRGGKRKMLEGPIDWYRVFLPYGNKYDKAFVQNALLEKIAPLPLIPVMWATNGNSATFYVDEFKTAEKLYNIDREIQLPDGFKLIIKVTSGSPNVDVTSELKEKMKAAMAKCYNAQTKALDLTKFHHHPDLRDVFCALFKPIICVTAIDIIAENIPEIEALSLNDNKIQILSHLRKMGTKLPNLKILYLGNNKLRDISSLDVLNGIHLNEVYLNGNPLCDKFKDKETYISEVRKRFPKLLRLDGTDLPPPISFDIEEVAIPSSKITFICNTVCQHIVKQFIEQYFLLMDDGDNRKSLLAAYHEDAMFSMTMAYPYGQNPKNSPWLNWYNTDNRNIQRVTDPERRAKLLKQGHVNIVAFLQEMPQTKHDINSFTVDITIYTPTMLLVCVTGIFKEVKSAHRIAPIRYFYRTFLIVPAGGGLCIANEELHISNATDAQAKVAFKTPIIAPVPPTPSSSPVSVPTQPVTHPVPDPLQQQAMVQAMSQETGMNLEWSLKCMEECQWDYQKGLQMFTVAKANGKIPENAFVK